MSDGYGFSQRFAVEHRMADALFVHAGDAGGAVSFSDVLHTEPATVGGLTYTLALCAGDGCRFAATPSTGYRFAGWYADEACTQQVSASREYRYVPASHTARLFARFERDATPLDAEGTANCYIAPGNGGTDTLGDRFGARRRAPLRGIRRGAHLFRDGT